MAYIKQLFDKDVKELDVSQVKAKHGCVAIERGKRNNYDLCSRDTRPY